MEEKKKKVVNPFFNKQGLIPFLIAILIAWCYLFYRSPVAATTSIWISQQDSKEATGFVRYSLGSEKLQSFVLSYLPMDQVRVLSQTVTGLGVRVQWLRVIVNGEPTLINMGRSGSAILIDSEGNVQVEAWQCSKQQIQPLIKKFESTKQESLDAIEVSREFFAKQDWQYASASFKKILSAE